MKFLLISMAMFFCSFNAKNVDKRPVQEQIKTILQKRYGKGVLFYSTHRVRFNLSFVCEDVLRDYYIHGFRYRNADLAIKNQELVRKVEDSISEASDKINEKCPYSTSSLDSQEKGMKNDKIRYVVFMSALCDNNLYMEVVPAKSVLFINNKYSYIGEIDQYYFQYNNAGEIRKYYTGVEHRD